MPWKRSRVLAIGIVGCGSIGSAVARYISTDLGPSARLVALADLDGAKARALAAELSPHPLVCSLTPLIHRAALVVEAAAANVSFHIAQQVLEAGRDCLVMSVGGLLGRYDGLVALARERGARLLIPSGALAGLDAVNAMRGHVRRVLLTTRKPPQALASAPFIRERRIPLDALREETTVFEGSAQDAVIGFPQNANVAATLALCTGQPEAVRVRIVAVPQATRNSHEVQVESTWGTLTARLESQPSQANPKTSEAAIASAQALLRSVTEQGRLGT